jgi:hypothetical protein
MKHIKLFENFNDIESICSEYDIQNYVINEDGSIDVDGTVILIPAGLKKITKIPLKFRNVLGDFVCSHNKLTSLEGSPQEVGGSFFCQNNYLTSLEYAPKSVGGSLICSDNKITTLEGYPDYVGSNFYCNNNPVYTIWELFFDKQHIEYFNFLNIITDVDGEWAVIIDRLNSFLEDIGKPQVQKVKGYINI